MESQEEIRIDIINSIENLINRNKLTEAKEVIEKYEEKIRFDTDIYSMKAVIYISEGDLKEARAILLNGLLLDVYNFDLLYNLAYVYEQEGNYIKAVYFYKYANIYCRDNELTDEILNRIDEIQKSTDFDMMKNINADRSEIDEFMQRLVDRLLQKAYGYYIENPNNEIFKKNGYDIYTDNIYEKKYIIENMKNFKSLFNELMDEKSKNILIDIISNRIFEDKKINSQLDDRQYFIESKNNEEKIRYIMSKNNVKKEVEKLLSKLENLEEDVIIIVFGVSIGEYVLDLKNKSCGNSRIIIAEPKKEILELFKASTNYDSFIKDKRISVYLSNSKEIDDVLINAYKSKSKVKFVCYSDYNKVFGEEYQEFCDKLKLIFNVNYDLQPEGFDYKLQEFKSREQIEVLVTGISYANYAIYEPFMSKETFNFALPSQDIFYDYQIVKHLMKFPQLKDHLKYVVITLCYYSFENDLSRSKQNLGILHRYIKTLKDTHNYNNIKGIEILHDIYEQKYLIDDYYKHIYMPDFLRNITNSDVPNQKYLAELQSSNNFPETVIENEKILDEYMTMLEKNNIMPILVVCPTSKIYNQYYSDYSKDKFYCSIDKIRLKHKFQLLDYFYSEQFDESEFYDGSHLNIKGAEKFAKLLEKDISWL